MKFYSVYSDNLENFCIVLAVFFLGTIQFTNFIKLNSIKREISEINFVIQEAENLEKYSVSTERNSHQGLLQRTKRDDRRGNRRHQHGDNPGACFSDVIVRSTSGCEFYMP